MHYIGVNEAARLTGKSPTTIKKITIGAGLKHRKGGKAGTTHEYSSAALLQAIYLGNQEGDDETLITTEQAQRQLAIARRKEIDLNMEVTRGERIPLEDIEAINDSAFSNAAAMLKANTGKVLDEELVNDIYAQFRDIAAKIKEEA